MEMMQCFGHGAVLYWVAHLTMLMCVVRRGAALNFAYNPLGTSAERSLILRGNAAISSQWLELTQPTSETYKGTQYLAGRVYNTALLLLQPTTDFSCAFVFRLWYNQSNPAPAGGSPDRYPHGDGMAFLLLGSDEPLDPPANSNGAWLGLFNAAINGTANNLVAVEFDTYKNPDFLDPDENHIGLDVNNILSTATVQASFSLFASSPIAAWVDYSSSQKLLQVFATTSSTASPAAKPGSSVLSHYIDLTRYLPENVYVGLSAGTGNGSQINTVLSWSFRSWTSVSRDHKTKLVRLVAGLCIAGAFFMALTLAATTQIRRIRRRRAAIDAATQELFANFDVDHGPREFSYTELSTATGGFSQDRLLGEGGFGPVYRGVLPQSNEPVAVKCISKQSSQGKREFLAEVTIISSIRHRHLVQLKGWCQETSDRLLLVYEFMPNGSLNQHLYKEGAARLQWSTRYEILCGLGAGVLYLHEECNKVILHRDIKTSNVMLDSSFQAKLGDFGLARQVEDGAQWHTTMAAGTWGYMAPECYQTIRCSTDSDVYSFGMVLLEVVCGRRPMGRTLPPEAEDSLLNWVWGLHTQYCSKLQQGQLAGGDHLELKDYTALEVQRLAQHDLASQAADARLIIKDLTEFEKAQMYRVLIVGLACCHPDPKARPSIRFCLDAIQAHKPLPTIPLSKPVAFYNRTPSSSGTSGAGSYTNSVLDPR